MRQFGYLVVEGPHDVEFCYRLLSVYGLKRVRMIQELDEALKSLVPRSFPHSGDLLKRVPVPLFLQNGTHAIAIHSAIGDTRLVETLQETLLTLDPETFSGVGLMLDSDSAKTAAVRYEELGKKVAEAAIGLTLPLLAAEVAPGPPRCGAFVLPDNVQAGTLEDLLLESAEVQYVDLLSAATGYVDSAIDEGLIPASHRTDIEKPAGRNKAVIGAMAALFKPGKAVQTSIQDNDWLRGSALGQLRIKAVQAFLVSLFDLEQAGQDGRERT